MIDGENTRVGFEQLSTDCLKLREGYQSLLLATVSAEGVPESSYAPYVMDEQGDFYIFVSELAAHTSNMMAIPKCSVLFVKDEAEVRNIFARERLSYRCTVDVVSRQSGCFNEILEKMTDRFGEMISLLSGLGDFHLLRLKPFHGRYVVGFGKAYDVDLVTGELSHINGR